VVMVDTNINDEVEYKFKTEKGIMRVKPSDILKALEENSNRDNSELLPPEEDLQGWDIISATDESGKSHPLFLMRSIPSSISCFNYSKFRGDDDDMAEIILTDVYKLTPIRVKWIQIKNKIRKFINRLFKRI